MPGSVIVFYDGVCGFCNKAIRFVAQRDRLDRFRFTPLQGDFATEILLPHDVNPNNLDTMYVLVDYGLPDERVYSRARGVVRLFQELGSLWAALGLLRLLPDSLLDFGYGALARNRYRLFGKHEQCPMPTAKLRRKFVEPSGVSISDQDRGFASE